MPGIQITTNQIWLCFTGGEADFLRLPGGLLIPSLKYIPILLVLSQTSGKLWRGSQTGNADRRSFWQAANRTAAGGRRSCPEGWAAPGP